MGGNGMTNRERFLLDRLQLCDLYTRANGITYRDVCGDKAEIFATVKPDGVVKLQANVYPFHMLVQPFTRVGLDRCKDFVRRWA
jgi:hypothetical protein